MNARPYSYFHFVLELFLLWKHVGASNCWQPKRTPELNWRLSHMAAAARTKYVVSELVVFTYGQFKLISVLMMTRTGEEINTKTVCLATCPLRYQICANIWISARYVPLWKKCVKERWILIKVSCIRKSKYFPWCKQSLHYCFHFNTLQWLC